ncbi:transposase [Pseudonocardia sp. ICBG1142]|uniref:transposase n=1 Tax=Pseudonocardia sp. ICBG1142 TaxID=2846760 RepID=UPI001CF63268|nr:transposase [Pseudonocardia sp. ICBG1142]
MPRKYPPEFKSDVVRVARRLDLTHAEVAADFDISVESVRRWVPRASPSPADRNPDDRRPTPTVA